jgi:hypothetical protein
MLDSLTDSGLDWRMLGVELSRCRLDEYLLFSGDIASQRLLSLFGCGFHFQYGRQSPNEMYQVRVEREKKKEQTVCISLMKVKREEMEREGEGGKP